MRAGDLAAPEFNQDLTNKASKSKELLSELRQMAKTSLYFLTKAVLGFKDLTPHLHQDICKEVQELETNHYLMLLLPRKHFKSTITTIGLPVWLTIQDYIPALGIKGCDVRVLIANESATNAEHFLSIIETIYDSNELFRLLFPEVLPNKARRKRWNAQEMLVQRDAAWPEATIETIGVGGAAQSRHYDVLILDDLIGKEAMDSETVMEKAISWFDYAESLSVSPQRSIFRVIGTRWSKRDLYQHIIEKDKKYSSYSRQCIEEDKPIFPEWYTMEYYDDLRAKNFAHFSSQYLNNPTDPERCDFKEEWLKLYTWEHQGDRLLIKFEDDEKPIDFRELEICGAFDPSVDEKPSASRRAIVYVGMDAEQRVVILDEYASRDTVDAVLDNLYRMYYKWIPRDFGVESVALQRIYLNLIEKEGKLRKQWMRAKPIKVSTRRSKEVRIRDTIQQVAAQGRLYRQQWMRDFDIEFIDFPQGKFNDILDATAHAIDLLRVPASLAELEEEGRLEEVALDDRSAVTGY